MLLEMEFFLNEWVDYSGWESHDILYVVPPSLLGELGYDVMFSEEGKFFVVKGDLGSAEFWKCKELNITPTRPMHPLNLELTVSLHFLAT